MINRRHFTQATLALAATPGLGFAHTAVAAPVLRRESIAVAVVQSRLQNVADELTLVLQQSPKDLVCFPALDTVDVAALRQAQAYVAVNDILITPSGDILSGAKIHHTDIGRIAFVASLTDAPEAEILIHLTAGPVSFTKAQSLAVRRNAHVVVATPVGDAFLQASGSVIFSPKGEVLAAAGAAWTQTVAATLHVSHWRALREAHSTDLT